MALHLRSLRERLSENVWKELSAIRTTRSFQQIDKWVVVRLYWFYKFVDRCQHSAQISAQEKRNYDRILARLRDVGLLETYRDLELKAAQLVDDVDLGNPALIGNAALELLGDKPRTTEVDDVVREAGTLLDLISHLPERTHPEIVQRALDTLIARLWTHVNENGSSTKLAVEVRRGAIARLFWAQNERDEHRPMSTPEVPLALWWNLIRELERLPLISNASARSLHYELNAFTNLLRYARELQVLRRRSRSGDGIGRTGEFEELSNFAADVLAQRLPPICTALESRLAGKRSTNHIGETNLSASVLYLRLLLQYHNLYVSDGVGRLSDIAKVYKEVVDAGLRLRKDGSYAPSSGPWKAYRIVCDSVRNRISRYIDASETQGRDAKPFVILVVGQPGTGKSQFIKTVVRRALEGDGKHKRKFGSVRANLSQATSVAELFRHAWKVVHSFQGKFSVPALVELEEFDSHVGDEVAQYRHALAPLWDGATQIEDDQRFGDSLSVIDLGPFIAVCVMSKVEDFATARRMLVGLEKGLDFLTRVDVVVEVPGFDTVATQLQFALTAAFTRAQDPPAQAKPATANALIGEVAMWALTWQNPADNFRTLSKALKTVESGKPLTFSSLNMTDAVVKEFSTSLCEYAGVDGAAVQKLLREETEQKWFMMSATKDAGRILLTPAKVPFRDALLNAKGRKQIINM